MPGDFKKIVRGGFVIVMLLRIELSKGGNGMNKVDIEKLLKEKGHITIDVVGDSITQGEDHCTSEETYVAQFAKMLAEKYVDATVVRYDGVVKDGLSPMAGFKAVEVSRGAGEYRIDVIRNGIGGNSVRRAINRISDFTGELANGRCADVAVFMFGINDALLSDSTKYVTAEKFGEDYREMLDRFAQSENAEIVIMSATTNDQTIDAHVAKTAKVAAERGLVYVDQNKVWNEHYDETMPNFGHGDWLSNVSYDACHPTPTGALQIARTLFESVN